MCLKYLIHRLLAKDCVEQTFEPTNAMYLHGSNFVKPLYNSRAQGRLFGPPYCGGRNEMLEKTEM